MKDFKCTLCGGSAGNFNADGAHNVCAARARLGLATPSLGAKCPECGGSGHFVRRVPAGVVAGKV